jgi:O-acetyl-ADP-ribose deacetylase (regulator of RNase III)
MTSPLWEDCKWYDPMVHSLDERPPPLPINPSILSSDETIVEANTRIFNDYKAIFAMNQEINQKIFLYYGNCCKLSADALIIGQNQSLSDRGEYNSYIFNLAGPALEDEIIRIEPHDLPINVGSSIITSSGNLPYDHIIHAVAPKYNVKNKVPAEYALHAAYRSALYMACNDITPSCKSIVICCLYLKTRSYPRFEAAHIALRTIRRFLEHKISHQLERICLCVNSEDDFSIYSSLMTAYFPRNIFEEEGQANLLDPNLVDNEWGEIVVKDRPGFTIDRGPRPSIDRLSFTGNSNGSSSLRPGKK